MPTPVTHYQLEWSPKVNRRRIVASTGSGPGHEVDVNSAEEFIAIALILDRPRVVFDNGVFTTGKIPVGA